MRNSLLGACLLALGFFLAVPDARAGGGYCKFNFGFHMNFERTYPGCHFKFQCLPPPCPTVVVPDCYGGFGGMPVSYGGGMAGVDIVPHNSDYLGYSSPQLPGSAYAYGGYSHPANLAYSGGYYSPPYPPPAASPYQPPHPPQYQPPAVARTPLNQYAPIYQPVNFYRP